MSSTTTATFKIWRGNAEGGQFREYQARIDEGMVVLDAVHQIQAEQAPDLAVRWNCKAGKCGSCSSEINGMPKLMCMTRMSDLPLDQPITVEPMHTFPLIKDLVTDVSWNFRAKKKHQAIHSASARRTRRHLARAAAGYRSNPGIPQMHRMLPVPGRLPRAARASYAGRIHRSAPVRLQRGAGDASAGHRRSRAATAQAQRNRLLQHH